ncbi:MAG: response regulator [SAR324 cluster bacterium]|nr:response regulator [SAR324 cluster bacterium]
MKKILIVDDSEFIIEQLMDVLTDLGYQPSSLQTGTGLLAMLGQSRVDLILMDIHMPEISGIELLKELREQPDYDDIPVVMMTSDDDPQVLLECFDAGAVDFIRKPLEELEIQARLRTVSTLSDTLRDLNDTVSIQTDLSNNLLKNGLELKELQAKEQDFSNFLTSVLYFILGNLETTSLAETLVSIHDFFAEEISLDTFLMVKDGRVHGTFTEEEKTFLKEVFAQEEYQVDRDGFFAITIAPLAILFRHDHENVDMDKVHTFLSTAAPRIGHVIELENKQIMSGILEEAILMVNASGKVEPGFSDICLDMFGIEDKETFLDTPPGSLFYKEPRGINDFGEWVDLCFQGVLDFKDVRGLQPEEVLTEDGRILELDIIPIYDQERLSDEQILHFILFKLTDITQLRQQEKELEHVEASNLAVIRVIQHRTAFSSYHNLVQEKLSKPEAVLSAAKEDLIRSLHTAKGMSGLFNLNTIQNKCHDAETLLKEGNERTPESDVVQMILSISEFLETFLEKNKDVLQVVLGEQKNVFSVDRKWYTHVQKQFHEKRNITRGEVNQLIRQITYAPLKNLFSHFDMMLQDLAGSRGKLLHSLTVHDDNGIFVPDGVLNTLVSSLIHIFRNAVDHGIEEPDIRIERNKDEYGSIRLFLMSSKEKLIIFIDDDGQGIDLAKLKASAVSKGVIDKEQANKMTEPEVKQLVFMDGFSTKEQADMISGRGVGMADVQNACTKLGGTIDYQTVAGKGTCWRIEVPLTALYGKNVLPGNFAMKPFKEL